MRHRVKTPTLLAPQMNQKLLEFFSINRLEVLLARAQLKCAHSATPPYCAKNLEIQFPDKKMDLGLGPKDFSQFLVSKRVRIFDEQGGPLRSWGRGSLCTQCGDHCALREGGGTCALRGGGSQHWLCGVHRRYPSLSHLDAL